MNSADLETRLIDAINARSDLLINYKGDGERTVQPHALYRRNDGKIFLDAVQTAGHSSSGDPVGWRQFELAEIASVAALDSSFEISVDYDPASNRYKSGLLKGAA
jgi:hypothetical protein